MIIIPPKQSGLDIGTYEIYKVQGHGVQESPLKELGINRVIENCDSLTAFIIAYNLNISLHGNLNNLNSWESPNYYYRLRK